MADSKTIDDGGSAFPLIPPVDETGRAAVGYPYPEPGMTLRDYFAIHADWEDVRHYSTDGNGRNMSRVGARYKYADCMIAARKAGA
ncbi:hypothetical protein [Agrobacterium rubi]|uniref:hypothetical protein n=1 Tax=Agrobacterium rubi TaxID=28099 RepID=UPI001573CD18|nr:hypothetical protein [Agrobacterium rubi]NTE87245.1 hypothetical protein [Agrobacterium rubi]NTF03179.1 hypothetical protein [Agrobacterium rubi]